MATNAFSNHPTQVKRHPQDGIGVGNATHIAAGQLRVDEYGNGRRNKTKFTITALPCFIGDTNTYGSSATAATPTTAASLYTFPEGRVRIYAASCSIAPTTTSVLTSTLNSGSTVRFGFGSAAIAAASMAGTAANIIPSIDLTSSTTINTAAAAVQGSQGFTAVVALDVSAAGTANNTLQDCTGSYSEAAVENNFADCGAKINELVAIINRMCYGSDINGVSTAAGLYANFLVPTATDIDADATLTITGSLDIEWGVVADY